MASKFFFTNENAIDNLKLLYTNNNTANNDLFHIKINDFDCYLPLEISVSLSTTITKILMNDFTQRELSINIKFRNDKSLNLILSILKNIQKTYENTLFEDQNVLLDLAEFGFAFGNTSFIKPIIDVYSKDNEFESITFEELLKRIDSKKLISKYLKQEEISYNNEIEYISKNFFSLSKEESFINWCRDINNISFLEEIISNQNLVIDSEDQLLNFILKLCKVNQLYHHLFSYVLIEYCSLDCVNSFLQYVNNYFQSLKLSNSDLTIIECLSKRCKYNLKDVPSKDDKRYKKYYKTYNYQENDVRNGILYNENKNQNVLITPSSNNNENDESRNPIQRLLEMPSNFSFYTKNIANSSITFSLKDKTPFNINGYMIRGNWNSDSDHSNQMKSWKLEGELASNHDWVKLDIKENQKPFNKYEVRVFTIPESDPLISVKLTQTAPNYSNSNNLVISSFEIYGNVLTLH